MICANQFSGYFNNFRDISLTVTLDGWAVGVIVSNFFCHGINFQILPLFFSCLYSATPFDIVTISFWSEGGRVTGGY